MAFMEAQLTGRLKWIELHGDNGITWVPAGDVPEPVPAVLPCEDREALSPFDKYYDGSEVTILTVIKGYGVRESAPGYLDCTAWEVFNTRALAEEMYASLQAEHDDDDDGEN